MHVVIVCVCVCLGGGVGGWWVGGCAVYNVCMYGRIGDNTLMK